MPSFKTHIHGNLPIEVEIDKEGDFMDAFVETKNEKVCLDLSSFEIEFIMDKNSQAAHDAIDEFRRNRDDWHRSIAEDIRRDK